LIAAASEHVPTLIEHAASLVQDVWVIGEVAEGSGVRVTA
jgi:hypothetical protein